MKKIIPLIISLLLIASVGFPQSLALSWKDGDLQNRDEIPFLEEPSVVLITCHVYIKNNSAEKKSVKVKMYEVSVIPTTMNYFCWANNCFPPGTTVSPIADTLDPGELNETGFYGDYIPYGILGTTRIMYTFFDENNTNDSISVIVDYISGYQGVGDNYISGFAWSKPYPNPADRFTSFDYEFPAGIHSVRFDVFDLLGSVVRTISLSEKQGKLTVPVSDLKEGIYFYTLYVDRSTLTSGKLVINR